MCIDYHQKEKGKIDEEKLEVLKEIREELRKIRSQGMSTYERCKEALKRLEEIKHHINEREED